jgi:hypothetical protein
MVKTLYKQNVNMIITLVIIVFTSWTVKSLTPSAWW